MSLEEIVAIICDNEDDWALAHRLRAIECGMIISHIERNLQTLKDVGFVKTNISFLQQDPLRDEVATLVSVPLSQLGDLTEFRRDTEVEGAERIDTGSNFTKVPSESQQTYEITQQEQENNYALEQLVHFDLICKELASGWLNSRIIDSHVGIYAYMTLRMLDLILVSYACAHVGSLDIIKGEGRLATKATNSKQSTFSIGGSKALKDDSTAIESGSVLLARRKLRCLDEFFGGQEVWVFHQEYLPSLTSPPLYLRAKPDDFADVWGPMWRINEAGNPAQTIRFDLERGSIVPSSVGYLNTRPDEEMCHWISNAEVKRQGKECSELNNQTYIARRFLLIGARDMIEKNHRECECKASNIHRRLQMNGFLGFHGSFPAYRKFDSVAVGGSMGGGGIGAPALSVSVTSKLYEARTVKETLCKRWINSTTDSLRNWNVLRYLYGVEISFCTHHARRVRLLDLLASATMVDLMKAVVPFSDNDECKNEVLRILDSDPTTLLGLRDQHPTWRTSIEKWIGLCLDFLQDTGFSEEAKTPRDLFRAFWVYKDQGWTIRFPAKFFQWSGFLDDPQNCAFVILEKICLICDLGKECQNPPSHGVRRSHGKENSVLQTHITLNAYKIPPPRKVVRAGPQRQRRWNLAALCRNGCKELEMGTHGRFKILEPLSKTTLLVYWAPTSLVQRVGKFLQGPPMYHQELDLERGDDEECNETEREVSPVRLLVV